MVGVAVSTLGVVVRFMDDTDDAGETFVVTDVVFTQLLVAPRTEESLGPAIDDAKGNIHEKVKVLCTQPRHPNVIHAT